MFTSSDADRAEWRRAPMSIYEIAIIERRLKMLARMRERAEAVGQERSTALFDLIREFNECKDIKRKVKLAIQYNATLERCKSWPRRLAEASDCLVEIDQEESELRTRLYCLKAVRDRELRRA
jgi:hypothetical protein